MPRDVSSLPSDYGSTLKALQQRIRQARSSAILSANAAMVRIYWEIGRIILDRQTRDGWGAKVVERLARDLRRSLPTMQGFSTRNLRLMRGLAAEYPDEAIVKQVVSQLPWGHVVRLIQRVKDSDAREWYMRQAVRQGWSRSVLELQMLGNAHARQGKAITNFETGLALSESRRAAEVFKDPYLFDFLGTTDLNREGQVEQALVDHIQQFMLELGNGFAFVGQINLYLSTVDDQLRHPEDGPTIGLLLCRAKHQVLVEYALRDLKKPIGVAGWDTVLSRVLPVGLASSLPSVEELEAELAS